MKKRSKIVVVGGGTGTYQVLIGLKKYPQDFDLTAIVTMSDSGGSSGRLRKEFGMLPPGDVRRALLALSNLPISQNTLKKLFEFRFTNGHGLAGHSLGNLLLAALTQIHGREDLAISEAEKILEVSGQVLPVTLAHTHLHGVLADGTMVKGETNIDVRRIKPEVPIREVYLKPRAEIYPQAKTALLEAEMIVLGPGDLYTSIVPNLLIAGVNEAIAKSKAKVVYICNLMTKHGETDGFGASDFIREIQKYLRVASGRLAYVLVNKKTVFAPNVIRWYKTYQAAPVEDGVARQGDFRVVHGDFAQAGKLVRHDPAKLASALVKLL